MKTQNATIPSALIKECDSNADYKLHPRHTSVWITIKSISVYVKRTNERVVVDLYPRGREMENAMASCDACFSGAAANKRGTNKGNKR